MEGQRRFLKQMKTRQVTSVGHILDNASRKDYHKPSEIREGQFFTPMNTMRLSRKICKNQGGGLLLLVSFVILAIGCSTADLSSDKVKNPEKQPTLREKAIAVLEKSLNTRGGFSTYNSYDAVRLKGTDVWHSGLVRFFTPVTEEEQKFEVVFSISGRDMDSLYLSGKRTGEYIGIEKGRTYRTVNLEKEFADSSKIRLYLEPLMHYFQWPYSLYESPVLLYAGKKKIANETYHLLLAS
jgi:hypothetical protein